MNKISKLFCALACSVAVFAGGVGVCAESEYKVYDEAGLLTDDEYYALEDKLEGIADTYGHDVIVYTTDSMEGMGSEEYCEYLRYDLDVGIDDSGIIYMVSMEDRDHFIYAFNQMYDDIMIPSIIDKTAEELQPYLTDGDYYTAFDKYADTVEYEIKQVREYGPNEPPSYAIPIGIGCGIIIGIVTVCVMKHGMKTTRQEAMANNYIRKGSFDLTRSSDVFLYSQVTRTKISTDSSSSESSHSGGSGGKF